MKELILMENCFGPDVIVDGESLFIHEYDNRDPKVIEDIQDNLITKLHELKGGMGMNDWYAIVEMITQLSNEYEYQVDQSDEGTSCDECGNYNHKYVYKKIKNGTDV
jgi:hypothetical protein